MYQLFTAAALNLQRISPDGRQARTIWIKHVHATDPIP